MIGTIAEKYSFKIIDVLAASIFSDIVVKFLISANKTVMSALFPPREILSIF